MINFDFLVAGCNTRCQHCYVNGGPGPLMPIEDVILCVDRLDALAKYLSDDTSFTLDHEPMNHPHIDQILCVVARTRNIQNYHHGMTTGVGLMYRKDKKAVVRAYMDHGYDVFGITIHGSAVHHDEIVHRKGAYDSAVAAAEYLRENGAKIEVSLMLNRYFAQDAEPITAMLKQLQPNYSGFSVPIFTPHRNMMGFEQYRASIETVTSIQGYLTQWHLDEAEIMRTAEKSTVASTIDQLKQGMDLKKLFAKGQDERYLTLHQDCLLYVGNSGAETLCLGDLRSIDLEATAAIINSLPGNRDYGAFYDPAELPTTDALITALEGLQQNMVYGDFESVIYRGLVELGIPTKILK